MSRIRNGRYALLEGWKYAVIFGAVLFGPMTFASLSAQTDSFGVGLTSAGVRGEISRPLEPPRRPSLRSNEMSGAIPATIPATGDAMMLAQTPPPLADLSAPEAANVPAANAPAAPEAIPDAAADALSELSNLPDTTNALPLPMIPPTDTANGLANGQAVQEKTPLPPNPGSVPMSDPAAVPAPGIPSAEHRPNGPRHQGPGGPAPVQVVVVPTPTQDGVETVSSEPAKEEDPETALLNSQLRTPRLTFELLLKSALHNDYERAIHALDFSNRPGISDKEKKALAYNLYFVINRLSEPDFKSISNDDTLKEFSYQPNKSYKPLVLIKKDGKFLFSPETLDEINDLFESMKNLRPAVFNHVPILCDLSDWWFQSVFGLRRLQWGVLTIVAVVGYLIGLLASKILYYLTITSFHLLSKDLSEYKISKKTWRPIGWLLMYTIWYLGILAAQVPPKVVEAMGCPVQLLAVIMFIITGLRLIDIFALWGRKKIGGTKSKVDELLIPLLSRSSKIVLFAVGVVMVFQAFGFSALGIVSGMGIGGIAIALAAQNTIANLFGSITVLMDRPFVIGDWIVTSSIEGEVETVGLRSTRIRTFYNSLVTVPNNLLTTAIIDNMGRRHFRRYKTTLGVQYDTPPDRIEAFCEGVRELILSYNFTRKDVFHVYANEFSASSIDILLVCFFLVPDTAAEYKARSTLILDIMRLAEKMDVRFAFPSQTIYNIRTQDKEYEEPLVPSDEFGRASASGVIEKRIAAEKARHAGAFGAVPSEKIAAVGELAETLSRKTEEVLKKRRFFRRAG